MFIAALFTIAEIWKQPVSIDGWMSKENVIYMEYYSAIKKKEILPFVTTWVDIKSIMLSEISQTQKNAIWYHLERECKNRYTWTELQNRTESHV